MTRPASTLSIPLGDGDFDRLRTLIAGASGLRYGDNKRYLLETRLQQRLQARGLADFGQYLAFLEHDPRRQEELTFLFNQITTNETSFYRNGPQVSSFQHRVLPELVRAKRDARQRRLRIWSAGCSSGEEAFTLAIIAAEVLGDELADWRVEVIGHDISAEMLDKAQAAEYGDYTMRATPLAVREKYFTRTPSGNWTVIPTVRKLVRFGFLNLSDDAAMSTVPPMDVIFCRNVLIYFDTDLKRRIVAHLANALNPGAWLFIGLGESLANLSAGLELVQLRGSVGYRKPGSIADARPTGSVGIPAWRNGAKGETP
jgi:chemotaxis protein methyltransferase CheR